MNSNPAFASLLRIRVAVLLALAAGVAFVADLRAQSSATWTSSNNTTWGNGTNWSNGLGPGTSASDRASFLTANGTANPNLTANVTTGAVTFNGTYTLSASAETSLTLLGSGAGSSAALFSAASGGAITISAPIILGNATAAQEIGAGSNAGLLTISGNITKSDTNSLKFATSAAIAVSGNINAVGRVSIAGAPGLTLSGNNSVAGWDLGSGGITLNSAGALGSSGSINWTGTGQLVFTANNTFDYSSRFTVDLNQRYTLGVSGAANSVTLASALTGNGTSAFQAGGSSTTGTIVLGNASNSFSGPVTVAGGTLSVAGIGNTGFNSHLGTNGTINLGSSSVAGTLLYTGAGETTDKVINFVSAGGGVITNNGSGTLTFTSNTTATGNGSKTFTLGGSGNGRFSGVIANGANATISLTKSGTGTWTLSGNNTHTGTTTVSDGTLTLSGGLNSSNVAVNGASAVLNQTSTSVISGTGTTFTLTSGIATLAGNNSFSGPVTVNSGTLNVAGIGNAGSNSHLGTNATINIGSTTSTGTLLYTGAGETSNKVINLAGTTGGATITNNGFGTLTFTSDTTATGNGSKTFTLGGSGNGTFSGVIANGANATISLTKVGAGTWTLSGNNTFTGGLTAGTGTLVLDYASNPTVVNSANTLTLGGGTLEFKAKSTGSSSQILGAVTATADTGLSTVRVNQNNGSGMEVTLGTVTMTAGRTAVLFDMFGSSGSNITIGTAIAPNTGTSGSIIMRTASGNYDFAVNGGNAATPLSARNATGNLTGSGGNASQDYVFTDTASIGSATAPTTNAILARTLRIAPTANNQTMTITNVGTWAGGGNAGFIVLGMVYDGGANDFTIAAASGSNGVSIRGGNNATGLAIYHMGTGKLAIGAGVYLGYAGATPGNGTSSNIGLFGTGLIDWQGSSNQINGSTFLNISGTTVRISGTIDPVKLDTTATGRGSMNIVLSGGGVLEAVNSDITRNVGTSNGQIQWLGDGGFSAFGGNRAVNLAGGGQLTWGSSSFVPTNNALVLSSTYSNSTIDFQNNIALGTEQRVVRVNNGTAAVDAMLSGTLSGSGGGLVKRGAGTLALAGTNSYTGATWIEAGTLQIGNGADSGSIASTSAVINNGALVYNVGDGNRTLAATISGTGSLAQNSSGTLTLTGNNTYTGATSVNAGTLLINGSTHSDSTVSVANGATLGGSGRINGETTIDGNLAPGNGGVGLLTFGGSLALNSQANVSFTLNGTTRGTNYNGITLNSNLTFGGSLTINVASAFLNSSQSATFSLFSGFNGTPSGNLASVSLSGAYGPGSFAVNGSGVWNLADSSGQWSFDQSTGNLAFAAIPEPSVYALLLTGLAAMAILNHRRRKARADVVSK